MNTILIIMSVVLYFQVGCITGLLVLTFDKFYGCEIAEDDDIAYCGFCVACWPLALLTFIIALIVKSINHLIYGRKNN